MTNFYFDKIEDWKKFEELCADLLEAEGFVIESAPSIDKSGVDLHVEEIYTSHDKSRSIRIKWKVQCKHYAKSKKNLLKNDVIKLLNDYDNSRKSDEGLFLIIDTDYSEVAKGRIDDFLTSHPTARITIWNKRQLISRIERHPQLLRRYNLTKTENDYFSVFDELGKKFSKKILIISDQSILAHNLASSLRHAGFEIIFLPFWNYHVITPENYSNGIMYHDFDLIVIFTGDSYRIKIPETLIGTILSNYENGASILFFPFLAWSSIEGKANCTALKDILPVKLHDIKKDNLEKSLGPSRMGNFNKSLFDNFFVENQYQELDPSNGKKPFVNGIKTKFGFLNTYEFLSPTEHSEVVWTDTIGNPMIIINEMKTGGLCYFNTCCHSCLSPYHIPSPLESSNEFCLVLGNIFQWLLEKSDNKFVGKSILEKWGL